MITYFEQNGCHNCSHVFFRYEYDEDCEYFCNHNKKIERPICGSVGMKEDFTSPSDYIDPDKKYNDEEIKEFLDDENNWAKWNKETEDWEEWSKPRKIKAWGKCELHNIDP